MIHGLERHCCRWFQAHVDRLRAGSPLLPALSCTPGTIDDSLGGIPNDHAVLQTRIERLQTIPTSAQVGMPTADRASNYECQAELRLRLLSPKSSTVSHGGDIIIDPPAATTDSGDLLLFCLLAALQEQVAPQADGDGADQLDPPERFRGFLRAAAGNRAMELRWSRFSLAPAELGEAVASRRSWTCTISVDCCFTLSPHALDGGRILTIPAWIGNHIGLQSGPPTAIDGDGVLSSYAPAEAIPLSDVGPLPSTVRDELAAHGVDVLGDLDDARVPALIDQLRSAVADDRSLLHQAHSILQIRRQFLRYSGGGPEIPAIYAMPASALLDPDAEQEAIFATHADRADMQARLATLGLSVLAVLTPEARERIRIGHLLTAPDEVTHGG